jgi:hypothetical protein
MQIDRGGGVPYSADSWQTITGRLLHPAGSRRFME